MSIVAIHRETTRKGVTVVIVNANQFFITLDLDDKRDDGFPLGIVAEFLLVVSMLSKSPNGHLIGSSKTKEAS